MTKGDHRLCLIAGPLCGALCETVHCSIAFPLEELSLRLVDVTEDEGVDIFWFIRFCSMPMANGTKINVKDSAATARGQNKNLKRAVGTQMQ